MFIIPIITLFLLYYYYWRKNIKHFGPVNYLITVYLIMGGVSLLLEFSSIFPSVFPYSFSSMAYLSICFFLAFGGFMSFRDINFKQLKIENKFFYNLLENIVLMGGFGAIIFFSPFAIKGLTGDVELNRLTVITFQETVLSKFGLINSIFSLFSNLFILAILFAFINYTSDNKKKIRKGNILLVSSFSYVIYVLSYVGRDGVVYWAMTYFFIYLLMKKFIQPSIKKRLITIYIVGISVFIIPFMIISVARFSNAIGGVTWQLLNYAGQELKNFNDSFYIDSPPLNGRLAFPEFVNIFEKIGFHFDKATVKDIYPYYLSMGVDPWIFKTFIGDLIMDFGKLGTVIFLTLFSMISRINLKSVSSSGTFNFANLILFLLLFQMILWGVFYIRLLSANFYIIAIILISIGFRILPIDKKSKLIIAKSD